jgi:hypothetical protein
MRGESGQASVEWIGLVLLVALGLAALVRFAPRAAEAEALGPELVHALACAARGRCDAAARDAGASARGHVPRGALPTDGGAPRSALPTDGGARTGGGSRRMVSAPPLVPLVPRGRSAPAAGPRPLLRGRALLRRVGRGAGLAWRRSWLLCLGYERARYGFLNPEVRFPGVPIPYSEDLRMLNDCLSPVDVMRDWELFRGPR